MATDVVFVRCIFEPCKQKHDMMIVMIIFISSFHQLDLNLYLKYENNEGIAGSFQNR